MSQQSETTRSPQEIIAEANELAREFYRIQGYAVPDDYVFSESEHPRAKAAWRLAVAAYEHLRATDLEEVLQEAKEQQE